MKFDLKKTFLNVLIGIQLTGCVRTTTQIEIKRDENFLYDLDRMYAPWEDIPVYKLTLAEAVELAIEHNLDLKVREQQLAVQEEILTQSRYSILPRLTYNNLYNWRNKSTAATAQILDPVSLKPVGPITSPFVSVPRETFTQDLTLSWSLIDFGLSYYRARQEANSTLISYFEYEKAKQNIILQVVQLYWRYAALYKGLHEAHDWLEKSNSVINLVQTYVEKGMISPIQAAYYNNQLLDSKIRIEVFGPIFLQSKFDFGTLLGLPPSFEIELIDVNFSREKLELPSLRELEDLALANRPELYGLDLQELNSADAVRIALIETFPDITPFTSKNHDSNHFLVFNNWYQVGVRTAWNLLMIPQNIQLMNVEQARKFVIKDQRLALSLGVLSQVHLAYALYDQGFSYFRTQQIYSKNAETVRITSERMRELHAKGDLELLVAQGLAYRAQLEALNLYAQFASSLELLNNSIGIPLYFREKDPSEIKTGEKENPILPVMQ